MLVRFGLNAAGELELKITSEHIKEDLALKQFETMYEQYEAVITVGTNTYKKHQETSESPKIKELKKPKKKSTKGE